MRAANVARHLRGASSWLQATTAETCRSLTHLEGVPRTDTNSSLQQQSPALSKLLFQRFTNDGSEVASKAIIDSLNREQQHVLLRMLSSKLSEQPVERQASPDNTSSTARAGLHIAAFVDPATASANSAATPAAPSASTLLVISIASGLPFVGFGFLDNFIMIAAGEEIDALFGARLGLSTLAAAGLGNMFADVAGIGFATYIEQLVRKVMRNRAPLLSKAQSNLTKVKVVKGLGASIGVMIGCLLGLTPLLVREHFSKKAHDKELQHAA